MASRLVPFRGPYNRGHNQVSLLSSAVVGSYTDNGTTETVKIVEVGNYPVQVCHSIYTYLGDFQ